MSAEDPILERLARVEEKLDRVNALAERLGGVFDSLESLNDLGRDTSLLMPPAVRGLTEGLAEVETGFQLEDGLLLLKRVLLSLRDLAWSLEQMENLIDWWRDMEPVLKIAVPHLIDFLDDLEQKGIFRVNRAVLNMYAKLASTYTPEDIEVIGDGFARMHGVVRKFSDPIVIQSLEAIVDMYAKLASVYKPEDIASIGEGFVLMHGLVKKFSDPNVIGFMERLAEVPAQVDLSATQPVGPMGLAFRLRSKECRQGLGLVVELTKALGKVAAAAPVGAAGGNGGGEPG